MAKPPAEIKKQELVAEAQLPDFLKDTLQQDAGLGTSQRAEDNLIPLIYILQSNSPQVNKRDEQYVEGAEPGDIWLRGTKTVFRGDEGIDFQSCYFHTAWCEWNPRKRGQFAGHHVGGSDQVPPAHLSAVQQEYTDEKGNLKKRWTLPNGNIVVFTRYHVGHLVLPGRRLSPFVIPFVSTGHTVSKGWMTMINGKEFNGVVAPAFAFTYHLETRHRSNDDGSWFQFYVTDDNSPIQNMGEYEKGRALCLSFKAGEKQIEAEENYTPVDPEVM